MIHARLTLFTRGGHTHPPVFCSRMHLLDPNLLVPTIFFLLLLFPRTSCTFLFSPPPPPPRAPTNHLSSASPLHQTLKADMHKSQDEGAKRERESEREAKLEPTMRKGRGLVLVTRCLAPFILCAYATLRETALATYHSCLAPSVGRWQHRLPPEGPFWLPCRFLDSTSSRNPVANRGRRRLRTRGLKGGITCQISANAHNLCVMVVVVSISVLGTWVSFQPIPLQGPAREGQGGRRGEEEEEKEEEEEDEERGKSKSQVPGSRVPGMLVSTPNMPYEINRTPTTQPNLLGLGLPVFSFPPFPPSRT